VITSLLRTSMNHIRQDAGDASCGSVGNSDFYANLWPPARQPGLAKTFALLRTEKSRRRSKDFGGIPPGNDAVLGVSLALQHARDETNRIEAAAGKVGHGVESGCGLA
jgi:hypothetical protein